MAVAGPTLEGMVALQGQLEPEAGQTLLAALDPLARPATADDDRSGDQRRADALTELARRTLEGGQLPQTGGVRPQLTVVVDLDSLRGHPGALGGEGGWAGPLSPQACRRLACDGALTRVLVARHPNDDHGDSRHGPNDEASLAARLQAAMALLPRSWAAWSPNPWTSAGPAESSPPPNAPPWPSATAAVSSPTAADRFPGVRAIIWSTGWRAAPPTSTTWPCSAGPTIG